MKMKDTVFKIMTDVEEGHLFYYIEADDSNGVEQSIKRGVSVNTFYHSNSSAWSALHICAEKGRYKCAEVLLENGADVNTTDNWGQSPLMYAVASEWMELIDLFLKYGANLDVSDSNGQTALHLALNCSNNSCMKKLHDAGADLNKKDVLGRSAIWHAASKDGRLRQLEYLLSVGADPNTVDAKDKFTPLQAAIWYAERDRDQYINCLLEAGKVGSLSPPDSDNSALMTIIHKTWCVGEDITEYEAALARRLVMAGCHVNVCAMTGLYKGMPVRYRLRRGTALKMAAHRGAPSMVKILLEAKADPDIPDVDGVTPLHMAVYNNHPECTRLLIAANANLHPRAKISFSNQQQALVNISPFGSALATCNIPLAKLLIEAGFRLSHDSPLLQSDTTSVFLADNPEFQCWLINVLSEAEDLKTSCRKVLRDNLGKNITEKVDSLPLPPLLQKYILLQDVLG